MINPQHGSPLRHRPADVSFPALSYPLGEQKNDLRCDLIFTPQLKCVETLEWLQKGLQSYVYFFSAEMVKFQAGVLHSYAPSCLTFFPTTPFCLMSFYYFFAPHIFLINLFWSNFFYKIYLYCCFFPNKLYKPKPYLRLAIIYLWHYNF